MSYKILEKIELDTSGTIFEMVIKTPLIAKKAYAGNFVLVRVNETGERIPLTIADSDLTSGTITIIVQGVGKTTKKMNVLNAGDQINDVVGPLGTPSHIEKFGTAVSIGGGVGTAIAYPTAVALKQAGNHVITINGARTKDLVILEDEMKKVSDESYITTDDGSYGFHGFVTDMLQKLIDDKKEINFVLAIGPIPMMQAVADLTKPYGIKTVVSLNPIMVDGTGMCGGCRVTVGGETKFACVDGPEFDGHLVDYDELSLRLQAYAEDEKACYEDYCTIRDA